MKSARIVWGVVSSLMVSAALQISVAQADTSTGPELAVTQKVALTSPTAVARDPLTNRLVVSSKDAAVSLVDASTFSILGTVTTNIPGQTRVQMLPENGRAYVVGQEPIVSVIGVADSSLVTQIPLNPGDRNAASTVISQADVPLLLISYRRAADDRLGAISLVSTVTNFNRITGIFPVETAGLDLPKDAGFMLLASPASNAVFFLDTFFQPFEQIDVEGNPDQIVSSPDGTRAYVSNLTSGFVDVINTVDRELVSRIAVGAGVTNLAITPDGLRLAAVIPSTGELVLADLVRAQVITRKKIGAEPTSVTFDDTGRFAYVTDMAGNSLLKVDTTFVKSSPPRSITVKPSTSGARVTWKIPSNQGSAPVTRYTVVTVPKGGKCVTTRLQCTLTGLKKGTTYTVRVTPESSSVLGAAASSKRFTIS